LVYVANFGVVLAKEVFVVSTETLEKRAYVARVLSKLLHLMGQGEVPLEFEEREGGQLAVALHIPSGDSPLKPQAEQRRSPLLNALQFLLNRLLKRESEGPPSAPVSGKVLLGIDGFPPGHPPKGPPQEALADSLPPEGVPLAPPCKKAEQMSCLAHMLAQKSLSHGRIYAVLLLSQPQRTCMQQATSQADGLRVFSEGEAHWGRLVFEPEKAVPMPQKSRIAFHAGGPAKSPKALAGLAKPKERL